MKKKFAADGSRPYAHMFYFELSETSDEVVNHFVRACEKYLRHPGQTYFSVGIRDRRENRRVSAKYFEVAVNMIFKHKAAYEQYRTDPHHLEFITEVAGMSPHRQVYDSFLIIEHTANNTSRRKHAQKVEAAKGGQ